MVIKNYLIIAHKNPDQLHRLVSRLSDPCSYFYIHVDLKSNLEDFICLFKDLNRIKFIKERVNCIWGDFSIVKATMNCIREVIADARKDSINLLLSGQDYPIKSNEFINDFLLETKGYDFISFEKDPIPEADNLYQKRVVRYKFDLSTEKEDFILLPPLSLTSLNEIKTKLLVLLKRKFVQADMVKIFFKRKAPFQLHYKGSAWLALQFQTLSKVYDYIMQHRGILYKYYQYTLCADEQFFHTILKEIMKNDDTIKLKPNLHYINWEKGNILLSPAVFDETDFKDLMGQPDNKLFARKFDMEYSEEILDQIDSVILSKS